MKIGLGLSLPKYRLSSFLDAATQAVFDYANTQGYTVASAETQTLLDNAITSLKGNGEWDKSDILYFTCTDGDRDFAKINVKNPGTFNLTEVGTVAFTSKQGFNSDGTTGYLDTGYDPGSNAVNLTDNSSSVFAWLFSEPTANGNLMGCKDVTGHYLQLVPRSGGNSVVRSTSSTAVSAADITAGLLHANNNSGTVGLYKNGTLRNSAADATPAVPSGRNVFLLALNDDGVVSYAHSSMKVSFAGVGANLASEAGTLYSTINTYISNI